MIKIIVNDGSKFVCVYTDDEIPEQYAERCALIEATDEKRLTGVGFRLCTNDLLEYWIYTEYKNPNEVVL